jgi:hypothetical protein
MNGSEISFHDLQQTLLRASFFMEPYRGRVTRLDRINMFSILTGLVVTIALSMSIGITKHWAYSLIFIVIFFLFAGLSIRITKNKSNRYLRQAHFMAAVFCRAENNRFFLRQGFELRPGFLAKWVEVNRLAPDLANNQVMLLEHMRDRWEHQKNMKEVSLFKNGTKGPPIPIKDIEQYKQDQQLAILLQEQEDNGGVGGGETPAQQQLKHPGGGPHDLSSQMHEEEKQPSED